MLCWKDVLHDGPVPAGLSLEELSEVRAAFLAARGWVLIEDARADFARRDAMLRAAKSFSEVVLWFEHDLYDQLQLIQILDWFAGHGVGWTEVVLVQASEYLGTMDGDGLRALHEQRQQVTREQYFLARDAWAAFRAPAPTGMVSLFGTNPHMPWLGAALRRFGEEYPWVGDGLSRTERVVLELAASGVRDENALFREYSKREDPVFMGDWSFFWRVQRLQQGREPLLSEDLELTKKGCAVLTGTADRILGEGVDLWLGGVHLAGEDSPWRWEPREGHFVPTLTFR